MATPGLAQSLSAEIQAHHSETQARQQSRFMAPTAAWYEHGPGRLRGQGVISEETGNRGSGPAQLPAITALLVTAVPERRMPAFQKCHHPAGVASQACRRRPRPGRR